MSSMTLERYQRVKDTFFACRIHSKSHRRQLYQLLCADDPSVVDYVLQLEDVCRDPSSLAALLLNWLIEVQKSRQNDQAMLRNVLKQSAFDRSVNQYQAPRLFRCDN